MKRKNARLLEITGVALIVIAVTLFCWGRRSGPAITPPKQVVINTNEAAPVAMNASQPAAAQTNSATLPLTTLTGDVPLIIDTGGDYFLRLQGVHRLPANLGEPEMKALFGFLLERHPEDDHQQGHVIKNDLMDALAENSSMALPFAQCLRLLLNDTTQHVVIRDYALQHMFTLFERLGDAPPHQETTDAREVLRTSFRKALAERDSSLAGTALVGLARLASQSSEFSKAQIATDAIALVRDENVGELTRISALQVCAQFNQMSVVADARALAERGSTVPIQISAIGALGRLGEGKDAAFLERLITGENERLRPSAAAALKALKHRLEPSRETTRNQSGA